MADTKAVLFEDGKFQAVGNNGQVVANGKLYFYESITGDKVDTFTTSTMETKNTWPIVLSASGKGDVYVTDGQFDVTLQDKNGVTVWTINNYIPAGGGTALASTATTPTKEEFVGIIGNSLILDETPLSTVDVHKNGLKLNTDEYALDGKTIVFVDALIATDEIVVEFSKNIAIGANLGLIYTVDTIALFKTMLFVSDMVHVKGYYAKTDEAFGSNFFKLKGVKTSEVDNGGTIQIATINSVEYVYELSYDGPINVKWFGALGDGNIVNKTTNLTAFNNAIQASLSGGEVYVPSTGDVYYIDTSLGRDVTTILVGNPLKLNIEGQIKASDTLYLASGLRSTIINVTADNVTISGSGSIHGEGTVDGAIEGGYDSNPTLIHVTGDSFKYSGLHMYKYPKIGIVLNGKDGSITNSSFYGGYPAHVPGDTTYFAIQTGVLGTGGQIDSNHFIEDPSDSGKHVNSILSQSDDLTISNNVCNSMWEKLCYINSDNAIVTGNLIDGEGDCLTAPIRFQGDNYTCTGNNITGCTGGVQSYGVGLIDGNTILDFTQVGISCFVPFDDGVVSNNIIKGNDIDTVSGVAVYTSDVTGSQTANQNRIKITDNNITGIPTIGGSFPVHLNAISPYNVYYTDVDKNTIKGGTIGIYDVRGIANTISGNTVLNAVTPLAELNSAFNNWLNNKCRLGTNIGISGRDATSYGEGNSYTNTPLFGSKTLNAAASTLAGHDGVASDALFVVTPKTAQAAVQTASPGAVWGNLAGGAALPDFYLTTADNLAAVGDETWSYRIIQ